MFKINLTTVYFIFTKLNPKNQFQFIMLSTTVVRLKNKYHQTLTLTLLTNLGDVDNSWNNSVEKFHAYCWNILGWQTLFGLLSQEGLIDWVNRQVNIISQIQVIQIIRTKALVFGTYDSIWHTHVFFYLPKFRKFGKTFL